MCEANDSFPERKDYYVGKGETVPFTQVAFVGGGAEHVGAGVPGEDEGPGPAVAVAVAPGVVDRGGVVGTLEAGGGLDPCGLADGEAESGMEVLGTVEAGGGEVTGGAA